MSKNKKITALEPNVTSAPPKQHSLSSDVRLEIREEVERRVIERISIVENHYKRQAAIITTSVAIVFTMLGITGIGWFMNKATEVLDTTEGASKTKAIAKFHDEAEASTLRIKEREADLKNVENIVTSQQLRASVVTFELKSKQLQAEYEFNRTLAEATDFKYEAYTNLVRIADNVANPYSEKARIEVAKLGLLFEDEKKNFDNYFVPAGRPISWPPNVDPTTLPHEYFMAEIPRAEKLNSLENLMKYVWHHPHFTKKQKMEFLIKVINESRNTMTLRCAGHLFEQEAKLSGLPLFSHKAYNDWWGENKERY